MRKIDRPPHPFDAHYLQKHTPGGQDHDQQSHAGGGGAAAPAIDDDHHGFPPADSVRDSDKRWQGPEEDDVSEMTLEAATYYSQDGFRHINNYVRTGQVGADVDPVYAKNIPKYVEKLDAFTNDKYAHEERLVYRGIGRAGDAPLDKQAYIGRFEAQIGKTVQMGGFQSTSSYSSIAARFAGAEGNPILEIKSKTGAPMGRLSVYRGEGEIMLGRGRKYKVLGVQRDAQFKTENGSVKKFTVIRLVEV